MRNLLGSIEYPVLVHCKSGADRAGLMSVIVRHVREGIPISKAKEQLSLRYGHVRSADTGVLDAVFERYIEDETKTGIGFWDWVETRLRSGADQPVLQSPRLGQQAGVNGFSTANSRRRRMPLTDLVRNFRWTSAPSARAGDAGGR